MSASFSIYLRINGAIRNNIIEIIVTISMFISLEPVWLTKIIEAIIEPAEEARCWMHDITDMNPALSLALGIFENKV